MGAFRPLGELPGAHVHRPRRGRGQDAGAEADELPVPRADLPAGHPLLPRTAAAPGRVRLLPSLRAVGRAARHHAGARSSPRTTRTSSAPRSRSPTRAPRSSNSCSTVYRDFGFPEFSMKFSDRPPVRAGADEVWDRAEAALRQACTSAGIEPILNPGDGAFYGPKLDFVLRDAIGREWQCGTFQVDFVVPGRLGAEYVGRGRQPAHPGHAAPRHPGQLRALPRRADRALRRPLPAVAGAGAGGGGDHRLRRRRLCARGGGRCCGRRGWRSKLDLSNQKINAKVRDHSLAHVPVLAVVGRKEAETRTVALRRLGGSAQEVVPLDAAVRTSCGRGDATRSQGMRAGRFAR